MKSFLKIVAEDIINKHGTNLSDVVIVFSNKRASLFFNQYLVDIVGKPLLSPQYQTMSELFHSKSNLSIVDNITGICTLYNVYQRMVPSNETIDAFWGWGEILLNDFNDIDKHIGNVEAILNNVRDLHLYDTIEYLSDEDKEMLKRFFSEFSDEHETKLKARFHNLWNKLIDIYKNFNEVLQAKGLTYEGAMYREVAQRAKDIDWGKKKYIFVGFNMLWETEQQLFTALKEKGLAYFYWDFDNYYIANTAQEAGLYLREWLKKYPNELDASNSDIYDNISRTKDINYLSTSSEDIQAQYVSDWLKEKDRISSGERTAIVLADESLLKSVVNHLPQEVSSKVNIAIGVPLSETPIRTFVDNFLRLHIYNFNSQERAFVLHQVRNLVNHPYTSLLVGKDVDLKDIIDKQSFVVETDILCQSEELTQLFSPIEIKNKDANKILVERLLTLLSNIGKALEYKRIDECIRNGIDPETAPITYVEQMQEESVYKMYTILNPLYDILSKEEITVLPTTLLRLIDQMISQSSMPFHGEPIAGLQITGLLESRNLDFDYVLVLSCNEGNMPQNVYTSSFIPYVVRKAHRLTTPENRVAVYAYYFYHLIQRCGDISFTFNTSTEDGSTGQMSRFMLQLLADEKNFSHLQQKILYSGQIPYNSSMNKVEKTPEIMKVLDAITYLSPSAINTYLRCPMKYYFKYVAGIEEPDNITSFDNRKFGNIFHKAAEYIYEKIKDSENKVSEEAIKDVLSEKEHTTIVQCVQEAIICEVFKDKKPHYDGLLLIIRDVIAHYVRMLLESDCQRAPFLIEGLEKNIYGDIPIKVDGRKRIIKVGGIIDRLERVTIEGKDVLRVVDYKTGSGKIEPITEIEDVFNPDMIEKHSDYFLQAMFYSMLVRNSQQHYSFKNEEYPPLNINNLAVQPAVIFVKKKESRNNPTLKIGETDILDIKDYEADFNNGLQDVIINILSEKKSFAPTQKNKRCENCAFARMCSGGKNL